MVEVNRNTGLAFLLTLAGCTVRIVLGTAPDAGRRLILEIARLPAGEQCVFCANRWIWL